MRSGDKKKRIFRLLRIFLWSNQGHESLLFKEGFPPNIRISSILNLVNIPTSALTLRKVSHSGDWKLRFLFHLFFWLENHLSHNYYFDNKVYLTILISPLTLPNIESFQLLKLWLCFEGQWSKNEDSTVKTL